MHRGVRDGGPLWQVGLFVALAAAGFLVVLQFFAFVDKHTHSHRAYRDYIFVGLMALGLATIPLAYRTFRQGWGGGMDLLRSLKWYHWLWFIIFISGLVFRKRTASEGMEAPVDSAAVFRIGCVGLVGLVLLCQLFLKKVDWLGSVFRGIVGGLIVFDLMALFSTVWSVYAAWTFYKAVEYGVDVCMLAVVIYMCRKTDDWKKFFDWTWVLYGVMLANVWVWAILDPQDGLLKGGIYGVAGIGGLGVWLQGIFPDVSSNQIAEYAACLAVVALCRLLPLNRQREKTTWYVFLFLASFVTMIFAQTRSAVAGFCVAVFLIYLLSSRVKQGAAIVIGSLVGIIATGFGDIIFDYLKRGQSANQLESFSSRLEWWEVALQKFSLYPFTGLGMWAAARFGVLAKIGFTQTATIHSDWVEIIVGTGAWGLTPVLFVIGTGWVLLIRYVIKKDLAIEDRQVAYEGMAVLAVVCVRMFFMTDLSLHPPCHFFAALGCAEFLRRKYQKQKQKEFALPRGSQLAAESGV